MRKEVYDVIHFHVSATDRFMWLGSFAGHAQVELNQLVVTVSDSGSFSQATAIPLA